MIQPETYTLGFEGHKKPVSALSFSPDGSLLLAGLEDGALLVWSVADNTLLHQHKAFKQRIYTVAFSPDGTKVLAATLAMIGIWELSTWGSVQTFKSIPRVETPVRFSPCGQFILSGHWVEPKKAVKAYKEGDDLEAFSLDAFTQMGEEDRPALWEVASGKQVRLYGGLEGHISGLAFSADGSLVFAGSENEKACAWETKTGKVRRAFEGSRDWSFNRDGSRVLTADPGATSGLWQAFIGTTIAAIDTATAKPIFDLTYRLKGSGMQMTFLSNTGRWAVLAYEDGTLVVLDGKTGKQFAALEGQPDGVSDVAFSSDDRFLAVGSQTTGSRMQAPIKVWEIGA